MHLERLAHQFTIGGAILAIILVGIALIELYHFGVLVDQTQKTTASLTLLLNKTDSLLTETQKSTAGLDALVNKTDQLIKIQSNTSSNISQQTIMREYSDQMPFKVAISYCYYEENGTDIAYSLIILDNYGDPTTLKFLVNNHFRSYTLPTDNGIPAIGELKSLGNDSNPQLVEPTEEQMQKLPLADILNQTNNTNNEYLIIQSQQDFAPYSEATGNIITKYIQDKNAHQMIEFKKNNNGNWELYSSQNSICNK